MYRAELGKELVQTQCKIRQRWARSLNSSCDSERKGQLNMTLDGAGERELVNTVLASEALRPGPQNLCKKPNIMVCIYIIKALGR